MNSLLSRNMLLSATPVIMLVLGVIAGIACGPSEERQRTLGTAQAYVDGVGQKQEIMPTIDHVEDGTIVAYNSMPATSGDHYFAPQFCGFYEGEVPDERVVHNLEHSNIVISYNLPDRENVESLREVWEDMGLWADHYTVVRRYSGIEPGQVALSAWGVLDVMDGIDQPRIEKFYEHYVGSLGPEGAISCRGPG